MDLAEVPDEPLEVVGIAQVHQAERGAAWLEAFVAYYLGRMHRADLECGCAMAALTTEVIRFGPEVRGEYEVKMVEIVETMARGLAGGSEDARRARAWAVLGILIGGVNVARAVRAESVSDDIAAAVSQTALHAAGPIRDISDAG